MMDDETVPINTTCRKRGCGDEVEFGDNSEIFDGAFGRCPSCGYVYCAVSYQDGAMVIVYDRTETRRARREDKEVPRG